MLEVGALGTAFLGAVELIVGAALLWWVSHRPAGCFHAHLNEVGKTRQDYIIPANLAD